MSERRCLLSGKQILGSFADEQIRKAASTRELSDHQAAEYLAKNEWHARSAPSRCQFLPKAAQSYRFLLPFRPVRGTSRRAELCPRIPAKPAIMIWRSVYISAFMLSLLGITPVNGKSPSRYSIAATSVKFTSVLHNAQANLTFFPLWAKLKNFSPLEPRSPLQRFPKIFWNVELNYFCHGSAIP